MTLELTQEDRAAIAEAMLFATKALQQAEASYKDAEQEESRARSASCEARNRLNAAQKAVDEIVAKMKLAAPRESDWGDSRRRKMMVPE